MKLKTSTKRRMAFNLIATGLLGLNMGTALADHDAQAPHCRFTGGTNACLWVTPVGADVYKVHVGIDVSMGSEDVQAALKYRPEDIFVTTIIGQDSGEQNLGIQLPLVASGTGPNGYGADFETIATGRILNEDSDGRDELAGKIRVYFPRTNRYVTFKTGQLNHNF